MTRKKGKVFPMIITIILIVIIIYLFATIKQPYVECDKKVTNDLGIQILENVKVNLDSNSIDKMEVTKTIILPEKYLKEEKNYLNSIKFAIKESYEYLPKKAVELTQESDRIITHITLSDNETIILNNIEFEQPNGLQIKINANTKAKDVITLKIKDSYTEGEFMTHMKNNGYSCK